MLFGTAKEPDGMESRPTTCTAIRPYQEYVTGYVPKPDRPGRTHFERSAKETLRNLVASNCGKHQKRKSDQSDENRSGAEDVKHMMHEKIGP